MIYIIFPCKRLIETLNKLRLMGAPKIIERLRGSKFHTPSPRSIEYWSARLCPKLAYSGFQQQNQNFNLSNHVTFIRTYLPELSAGNTKQNGGIELWETLTSTCCLRLRNIYFLTCSRKIYKNTDQNFLMGTLKYYLRRFWEQFWPLPTQCYRYIQTDFNYSLTIHAVFLHIQFSGCFISSPKCTVTASVISGWISWDTTAYIMHVHVIAWTLFY